MLHEWMKLGLCRLGDAPWARRHTKDKTDVRNRGSSSSRSVSSSAEGGLLPPPDNPPTDPPGSTRSSRFLQLLLCLTVLLGSSGCFTHRNTFGQGAQGGLIQRERTWYAFWGFLPLDDFDSRTVVGGAKDYEVYTGFAPSDVALNLLTAPLGFYRTTTRIEK